MGFNPETELYDSSRVGIDVVVAKVGGDEEKFRALYGLAMKEKEKYSARACRVIYFCALRDPSIVLPYVSEIIRKLPELKNESVKRDFLHIFAELFLPEDEEDLGRLLDYCFGVMNSVTKQVSLKIYSMEILYRISLLEPELKQELALTIENQLQYGSAGFRSRGSKIVRKLGRL